MDDEREEENERGPNVVKHLSSSHLSPEHPHWYPSSSCFMMLEKDRQALWRAWMAASDRHRSSSRRLTRTELERGDSGADLRGVCGGVTGAGGQVAGPAMAGGDSSCTVHVGEASGWEVRRLLMADDSPMGDSGTSQMSRIRFTHSSMEWSICATTACSTAASAAASATSIDWYAAPSATSSTSSPSSSSWLMGVSTASSSSSCSSSPTSFSSPHLLPHPHLLPARHSCMPGGDGYASAESARVDTHPWSDRLVVP